MPRARNSADAIRARRRRRLAAAGLLARGSGVVATAVSVLSWSRQDQHTTALVAGGLIAIFLMLVALGANAAAYHRPTHRAYATLRTVEGALDCGVITAAVVYFSALNQTTSWPVLVIPILLASYTRHIAGALVMWLITAGSYALVPWLMNGRFQGDLAMAAGLLLIIGIAAGTHGKAFLQQVQELHAARADLVHLASHDVLTGLANRSLLADYAAEHAGERLAVLVLDLDEFKRVNDSLGHAAGDELLRTVARRISGCIGPRDLASRVGGDEFIVLLAGATAEQATGVADRIRTALGEPVSLSGVTVPVLTSVGIAHRDPGDDTDLQAMIERADGAMYRDKRSSRRAPLVPAAG